MRLIDADALIDLYKDSVGYSVPVGVIIANIEDATTIEPEPKWIPCSERLPEEDDYRPCYGYDDGAVWWINDIGQMGLGWYYTSTRTWAYYDEISASEKCVGNVIAWHRLPEPYRKEGD